MLLTPILRAGLVGALLLSGAGAAQAADPFDLSRVMVWRNGSKTGRLIARGVIPAAAVGGGIDVSSGLTVSVTDADQLAVQLDFDPSECTSLSGGRARCARRPARQRLQRVRLSPDGSSGDVRIRIFLQKLDIPDALVGPATVTASNDALDVEATSGPCAGGQRRLFCR